MVLSNTDIVISGWNGKMGQTLRRLAHLFFSGSLYDFKSLKGKSIKTSMVWIDFSHANAFESVIEEVRQRQCPLVMGTTGLLQNQMEQLKALSSRVPVVYDTNFSVGIHVLRKLLRALPFMYKFDITIFESHHASKKDCPSGTAKTLQQDIKQACATRVAIPILSHRGGGIRGEHSVVLSGENEVLTLKHSVLDRSVFAEGALSAAVWILKQSCGFFSMEDVLL